MDELKACPFCEKKDALELTSCVELEACSNFESCDTDPFVCVVCSCNKGGCGATGGYADSVLKAVEKWSRRHTPENKVCKIMTLDDAIAHCNDKAQSGDACGANHAQLRDWLVELKALKVSPENKPLTLEQLRQMDGEPVYLVYPYAPEMDGWQILKEIDQEPDDDGDIGAHFTDDVWESIEGYGEDLLAYARKPEVSE